MDKQEIYTDIRSFAEGVSRAVSRRLGDGCQVKLQEVLKNNGVLLQGLIILTEHKNLSPTIYLNSFWEHYISGTPMDQITSKILKVYEKDMPEGDVDMSFFRDFEKVRDKICYKLVNTAKNKALLEQIPHVDFLDLSICFYYVYEDRQLGTGAILIHNSHTEMWNCTVELLMKTARENTERMFPGKVYNMGELLAECTGCNVDVPMKVLSNEKRVNGAVSMIYRGVLAEIAEQLKENLYILPSSVHEVIIMPHSEVPDPEYVQKMIREINANHVEPEEILSDSLYFYNRLENRIDSVTYLNQA